MPDCDPEKALAAYFNEVNTVKPLTKAEESNLLRELAASGDWDDAREKCGEKINRRSSCSSLEHCTRTLRFERLHLASWN
jgi:hypothetical protein